MREVIKEAREVNEAIDLACAELGVERDRIDFEIISLPKRGLLGIFGNTPAKVKVTVVDDPEPVVQEKKPEPRKQQERKAPEQRSVLPKKEQQPPRREKVAEAPKASAQPKKPQEPAVQKQKEKPAQPKNPPKASAEQKPAQPPRRERMPKDPAAPVVSSAPAAKVVDNEPMDASQPLDFMDMSAANDREKLVADYVLSVLRELGIQAEIKLARTAKGVVFQLWGDGLGVIIGRRGETLDALQYLASLIGNRGEKEYMRVTLDSGNYREKREQTLQRLAKRIASNVQRTGRSTTLESMNPYERRIIHAAISTMEGVTSSSIGEEPNRRVVISSTRASAQRSSGGYTQTRSSAPRGGNRSGGYNRGGNRPERSGTRPEGGSRTEGGNRGGNRPPRSNFSGNRPPRTNTNGAAGAVTSTDVDKEYAALLPKEPVLRERPAVETQPALPVREKSKDEAGAMPLYGKIDI